MPFCMLHVVSQRATVCARRLYVSFLLIFLPFCLALSLYLSHTHTLFHTQSCSLSFACNDACALPPRSAWGSCLVRAVAPVFVRAAVCSGVQLFACAHQHQHHESARTHTRAAVVAAFVLFFFLQTVLPTGGCAATRMMMMLLLALDSRYRASACQSII